MSAELELGMRVDALIVKFLEEEGTTVGCSCWIRKNLDLSELKVLASRPYQSGYTPCFVRLADKVGTNDQPSPCEAARPQAYRAAAHGVDQGSPARALCAACSAGMRGLRG